MHYTISKQQIDILNTALIAAAASHFVSDKPKFIAAAGVLEGLLAQPEGEPVAWHTDDHLTDRSATTYSKDMMRRWQDKGWPVTPHFTHPAPIAQPEDDGSDWFYKLQFICRVLGGVSPDKTDMQTALGMARSLKRERWTAEKALQPITPDMVTKEMQEQFLKTPYDAARKDVFVAAVNAWGAKK